MAALELHIYGWKREDDGVPLSNYFLHAKMKSHSGLKSFLKENLYFHRSRSTNSNNLSLLPRIMKGQSYVKQINGPAGTEDTFKEISIVF